MSKYKFNHPRLDASENLFLQRQLKQVRAKSYDVKFPMFKARMLVPIDNSLSNGANKSEFETYEEVGKARVGNDYTTEPPRVDLKGSTQSQRIKGIVAAYGFSVQEVRSAIMAGKNLPQMKANAARKIIEQEIDELLLLGSSSEGLSGLFLLSGTATYTVPNGAAASPLWQNKTSDEILLDINSMISKVIEDTKGVEKPNTLVLPLTSYNLINTKRMGDGLSGTVLDFFRGLNPDIQVEWSNKLESNAGWTGKRMVAYVKSPDHLQGIVPQEFEQFAPDVRGFESVVNCHARCGGVELYYPKSAVYGDNI